VDCPIEASSSRGRQRADLPWVSVAGGPTGFGVPPAWTHGTPATPGLLAARRPPGRPGPCLVADHRARL